MANVDVSFTALPAHVRTARLIALAVARRSGVPEDVIEEVRLAVGEACSRAVGVNAAHVPPAPVSMRLSDDADRFTVEVTDCGALEDDPRASDFAALDPTEVLGDDARDGVPSGFGLVVIGGLVEHLEVTSDAGGTHVTMAWPATT